MHRGLSFLALVACLISGASLLLLRTGPLQGVPSYQQALLIPNTARTFLSGSSVAAGASDAKTLSPSSRAVAAVARSASGARDHSQVRSPRRPWAPGFLPGLRDLAPGKTITFDLVNGSRAIGEIEHWEYTAAELTYVSGCLSVPEPGRFFFQKQTVQGVLGPYFGIVEFPASKRAFRIEPTPDGGADLVERPLGDVVCLEFPNPALASGPVQIPPLAPEEFPDLPIPEYQEGIPQFQSLPVTKAVIFLDFRGGYTPSYGGIAYARPNFSSAQIREIWQRVAEDYMPFAINVTTDLKAFENAAKNSRQRVIITPTDTAAPGAGGAAYVGSFNSSTETPCWAFATSNPRYCAQACSHEAGHALGLSHSGRYANGVQQEYYYGHGSGETGWAPIMGVGYYQNVTQWSRGEYANANNPIDQLAVIASQNNVRYRDGNSGPFPNAPRYLEILGDYSVHDEGAICRAGQLDVFQFTTRGGLVSVRADPVSLGPNLALKCDLANESGAVIASSNPLSTLWAALATDLPAGTYSLRVAGTGRNDPQTNGFSAYGSLGYYSITGFVENAEVAQRFSIGENSPNGTVLGVVPHPDGAGPVQFRIISGNSGGTFALDDAGVLSVASNALLDYEALASNTQYAAKFDLSVDIINLLAPELSETNRRVVVAVTNINEPPQIKNLVRSNATFFSTGPQPHFAVEILEHSAPGTVVGTLQATDPDFYTLLSYSIISGNTDGMLAIGEDTGRITIQGDPTAAIQNLYDLTVVVSDRASPNPLTATSVVSVAVVLPYSRGSIAGAGYLGIPGTGVSALTSNARFPLDPAYEERLSLFEARTNVQDQFGEVLRGYLLPPASGAYTFWIASRDNSELWLSSSTNPASITRIAAVAGDGVWTAPREWTKYPIQQSVPIALRSGFAYYIEARWKAGNPANHLAVAWECAAANIPRQVIPGQYLSPFQMNYVPHPSGFSAYVRHDAFGGAYLGKIGVADVNNELSYSFLDTPFPIDFPDLDLFFGGGPRDTFAFAFILGNEDDAFAIDPATGVLRLAKDADAAEFTETNRVLVVRATDSGSPPLSGDATVSLNLLPADAGLVAAAPLAEVWTNIAGTNVSDLTAEPRYPRRPDVVWPIASFDLGLIPVLQAGEPPVAPAPIAIVPQYHTAMGSRIRALLTPPQTGAYIFFISSSDDSRLLLSGDTNASDAKVVASIEGGATAYREWNRYGSQSSNPHWLEASKQYYIETLHKGGGSPLAPILFLRSHVEVAWSGPGLAGTNIIAGAFLAPVDIGHAPEFTNRSVNLSITSETGALVANLSASDSGAETLVYRLLSGNTSNTFSLDPVAGDLVVADDSAFAGYAVTNFTLVVQAQDSGYGGLYPLKSTFATVTIRVVDDSPAVNWTGYGPDNRWSTATNWDGALPDYRTKLAFLGPRWLTNYNDLLTDAGHVSITGDGFLFKGNPLTLHGGITHRGGTNLWAIASSLQGRQTLSSDAGTLVVSGAMHNLGDWLTIAGRGTVRLDGPLSGTGVLYKTSAGTLVLSAANSFSGRTTVDEGRLVLTDPDALHASPAISLAPGTVLDVSQTATPFSIAREQSLLCRGTIIGPIIVQGTLACTSPPSWNLPAVSLLAVSNQLTLAGRTVLALHPIGLTPFSQTVQRLSVAGALELGGTLTVTMDSIAGLRPGATFQLFEAASLSGSFSSLTLPAGTRWDTSRLGVNGTITFIERGPSPPLLLPPIISNGAINLRFNSESGATYYVEISQSLSPPRWGMYTSRSGTGQPITVPIPLVTNAPSRFFRLRAR